MAKIYASVLMVQNSAPECTVSSHALRSLRACLCGLLDVFIEQPRLVPTAREPMPPDNLTHVQNSRCHAALKSSQALGGFRALQKTSRWGNITLPTQRSGFRYVCSYRENLTWSDEDIQDIHSQVRACPRCWVVGSDTCSFKIYVLPCFRAVRQPAWGTVRLGDVIPASSAAGGVGNVWSCLSTRTW